MRLKLKEIRKSKKLTLKQVCKLYGRKMKPANLSKKERGEVATTVEELTKLAIIYHCPISKLLEK